MDRVPNDLYAQVPADQKRLMILCGFLISFEGHKSLVKDFKTVAAFITKNSLKASTKDILHVDIIMRGVGSFMNLKIMDKSNIRVELGIILVELAGLWPTSLLLAQVLSSTRNTCASDKFTEILEQIKMLTLEEIHLLQPLLNGDELADILQLKPGKEIGEWKQVLFKWQLANPTKNAASAIEFLLMESMTNKKKNT